MSSAGARIQIQNLSVVYEGGITALDQLDLDIAPGEFVTLLGPSGSGKTSALMAIAGFVDAAGGRVVVGEDDILRQPPNQRNLGLVFQDYALFPHMTVAQNIGFPLRMRQWPQSDIDTAVERALHMVRLDGYGDRRPTHLSGGEQQRVALARATVFQPPVLLMDEPLGALDKQLREQLQRELARVQHDTGITTLYVTHDQDEAMALSDRIAVLRAGRIEQIGTPVELYESPANRFVAGFIGESNFVDGRLVTTGQQPELETPGGWRLPLQRGIELPDGAPVEVAIRPERMHINAPDTDILVNGEIVESTYGGDMIRFEVRLTGGTVLTARQQNRGAGSHVANGERITLGWNIQDMTVIPGRPGETYDG